jgi:Mrp family chromosome partitioning ATPase
VIACGTRHHHGPELLGSVAMRDLMAALKSRYNVIIVDSPPLGAGIDPFVLGTATGNLLLVLRSGETDRQMAESKLRLLDRLPIRLLGAVLNDVNTAESAYKYYRYVYGYTADEEPTQIAAGT